MSAPVYKTMELYEDDQKYVGRIDSIPVKLLKFNMTNPDVQFIIIKDSPLEGIVNRTKYDASYFELIVTSKETGHYGSHHINYSIQTHTRGIINVRIDTRGDMYRVKKWTGDEPSDWLVNQVFTFYNLIINSKSSDLRDFLKNMINSPQENDSGIQKCYNVKLTVNENNNEFIIEFYKCNKMTDINLICTNMIGLHDSDDFLSLRNAGNGQPQGISYKMHKKEFKTVNKLKGFDVTNIENITCNDMKTPSEIKDDFFVLEEERMYIDAYDEESVAINTQLDEYITRHKIKIPGAPAPALYQANI